MRRAPAFSVRGFVLAAAFCALGVVAGCGRESFDLLPSAGASGMGLGSTIAGNSEGGGAGLRSGAGGTSGNDEGVAGRGGTASFGGRSVFQPGGGNGGNSGPCNSLDSCMELGSICGPSAPFCIPCQKDKDCPGDERICDPSFGRCVACRKTSDCADGYGCNVALGTCSKKCQSYDDCALDGGRPLCNVERGLCVSCLENSHCIVAHDDAHCYAGACVECFDNRQCATLLCVAGHCQNKH